MTTKEAIYDAQALADFSNLEDDVGSFRARYPDFAPEAWWTGGAFSITIGQPVENPTSTPLWKAEQRKLRDAWQKKFPLDACVQLIVSGAKVSELDQAIHRATEAAFKMDNADALEFLHQQAFPEPRVWRFQRAIMLLYMEPWRAVFCMACGKRFAKDTKGRLYCSTECFDPRRSKAKREWWKKHGKKWRAERGKNKSSKSRTR